MPKLLFDLDDGFVSRKAPVRLSARQMKDLYQFDVAEPAEWGISFGWWLCIFTAAFGLLMAVSGAPEWLAP